MKTKLTLLAAALVVGLSATTASANPWKGMPFMPSAKASTPVSLKSCCDVKTRYTTGFKGSVQVNREIGCNTGCTVPHAGKSCSRSERKACAN